MKNSLNKALIGLTLTSLLGLSSCGVSRPSKETFKPDYNPKPSRIFIDKPGTAYRYYPRPSYHYSPRFSGFSGYRIYGRPITGYGYGSYSGGLLQRSNPHRRYTHPTISPSRKKTPKQTNPRPRSSRQRIVR